MGRLRSQILGDSRGDRVYLASRLSWHNVNISPRLCKSATPVGQYEELHLSLEGS
jgi:hypothetical protein